MSRTEHITNEKVSEYIKEFYSPLTIDLMDFRSQAEREGIPIIMKETESFLRFIIELLEPKKILEIGTAIGYSACVFAQLTKGEVFSIEKKEVMFDAAEKNIKRLGYEKKVHPLLGDGEEVIERLRKDGEKDFDFIFIDAAKSHYKRFFEASLKVASPGALLISDNVLFGGRVVSDEYDPLGKHKTNVRNMREFNKFIMEDSRFTTVLTTTGDGLAITKLK